MTTPRRLLIPGPLIGNAASRLPADDFLISNPRELMFQSAFEDAIREVWGVVCMAGLKIDRRIIDLAPELKVISNVGVGYDNIDSEYAGSKGITVTNTPDVLTESTAELGFSLLLAAARRVVEGDALMRSGRFERARLDLMLGSELHGKKLGILGCGRIGQAIARMAAGFQMRVIYHNRRQLDPAIEADLALTRSGFDQLLAESDFIVITAPLNEGTAHLFTIDSFHRMKRTAVIVNIGRGKIIKEVDLVSALQQRLIAAAAIDVLESPPKLTPGLKSLPNLVLTPHIGSATIEARTRMCDLAIEAILDVHHGRTPRFKVAG